MYSLILICIFMLVGGFYLSKVRKYGTDLAKNNPNATDVKKIIWLLRPLNGAGYPYTMKKHLHIEYIVNSVMIINVAAWIILRFYLGKEILCAIIQGVLIVIFLGLMFTLRKLKE